MRVELGRIVGFCLALSLPPVVSSSCATGEEDPSFTTDAGTDSSAGNSFGGMAGDPSGGTGGSGTSGSSSGGVGGVFPPGGNGGTDPGGNGGTDPGGSGGTDPGGSGGELGASGTGTNGSSGTGGGSSCNPAFCPNTGSGTPCCIPGTSDCGMDTGMGCMKTD